MEPSDFSRKDLLILRVFGSAGRTFFLVQIQEVWQFLGASWTVASVDYFSTAWRAKGSDVVRPTERFTNTVHVSHRWIGGINGAFLVILTMNGAARPWTPGKAFFLAASLAVGLIAAQFFLRHAAIDELRSESEVVLLDLRGFTAEKSGVVYELCYVLNAFPQLRRWCWRIRQLTGNC
jgi:hypothetical protein